MRTLVDLIDTFPKHLIAHLRASLKPRKSSAFGKPKMYSLLSLILNFRKNDDAFYIHRIYGHSKSSEFRLLKHRLKRKIIECLIQEDITNLNPDFEKIDKQMLECSKQLYAARILLRLQGNSKTALELINQIEQKVVGNEHYALLLECLNLKKYNSAFINPIKDFNKINADIEKYHSMYKLVNKANDYYYQFIVHPQMKSPTHSAITTDEQLRNAIYEIKRDIEFTQSKLSRYFLLNLEMEYCNRTRDFDTGLRLCEDLIDLVANSPSVYRKQRMGNALINIAFFQAKLTKTQSAISSAENALRFTIDGSINYLLYSDILTILYIYNNQLDFAEEKINECLMIAGKLSNSHFESKFYYLKAITHLRAKSYPQALRLLSTKSCVDQDKAGMNVFQKIHRVILLISAGNIDVAESYIDSLTRQYYEFPTAVKENPRVKGILDILNNWKRSGFSFRRNKSESMNDLYQQLIDLDNKYPWEPLTSEVVSITDEIMNQTQYEIGV